MPRTERESLIKSAGNRLLAALSDDSFILLEPDLRQLTLPQGVVCYGAGDPIDQVYFPHTGMISQLITTGDGDMVETSSVGREGAVGLQCGLGPRLSFTRTILRPRVSNARPVAAPRCASLSCVIPRRCGRRRSRMPLAMPFTMARRGCAGGCCNAPTGPAASSF